MVSSGYGACGYGEILYGSEGSCGDDLGIDVPMHTLPFDGLRQGVEMRVERHRHGSTQPKFWAGNLSHEHVQNTFGFGVHPSASFTFDDMRFNVSIERVIAHLYSGTISVTDAFSTAGDDDGDIEALDGIFEPLEIRHTLVGLLPTRTITRQIRGSFGGGTADEPILQFFLHDDAGDQPFKEQGTAQTLSRATYTSSLSPTSGTVVTFPERLTSHDVVGVNIPYDDSLFATPSTPREFITGTYLGFVDQDETPSRSAFVTAMLMLSASTDVEAYRRRRYQAAGFQHAAAHSIDSIAFSGLMRYRRPQ